MKYFVFTFGCQMNKADSERIAQGLERKKHKPALSIKEADLVVVNMCSVRQSAVNRVFGLKEKLKGKKTILTGCILKKDRKKLEKIFDKIIEIENLTKGLLGNSSLLPIMKGCNNFCSYCVVPYTRGRETSRPAEEIICQAKKIIKKGVKEIWLLGQNVNSYKSKSVNFPKLLRMVNKIPGEFWIKFTSSHPKDFSNELIKAMKECKKVCPYLNLPVQSGDNKILKKMNRPYTIKDYKGIIKKVRKAIPDIAISTDIIVGFPGETRKQFENTKKLFKEIKYDMAYINKYSPRPGTAAEKLKDNVSPKEKIKREKELTEILKKTAMENNKKLIGKTIKVLIAKPKMPVGKTKYNKRVKITGLSSALDSNGFVKAKITKALSWGLKGEKLEK